jgi:Tol biopolymer transport system component
VTTTPQAKIGQGIRRVIEFALSPNGKLIAFGAGDGKDKNLCVVHADGSGLQKLANTSMAPSWSPDGKWIAFDGTPKGRPGQIWIANPDGRHLRDLSNDASYDYALAWAPATR